MSTSQTMNQTDDSRSSCGAPLTAKEVECYSGHTYAQEPRHFVFGDKRLAVTKVCRRWREPTGPCFEVLASNGATYMLTYNEAGDFWSVFAHELTLGADVHRAKSKSSNREDGQR